MGNRFATLAQYHRIVLAHGILGAFIFLLFVPAAVMLARFYAREPGYARVYHAQLQVFSALLLLVVFMLGFFAVGPERNLTNPHHGIGVAIFVLFLLQLIGGRLVRYITKARSLRITFHQWSGRTIALLGIIQVPLGLTLYGSPKYLFVLYTLWMTFLLLVYFILSYRAESRRELIVLLGRSDAGQSRVTESEFYSHGPGRERREHSSSWMRWVGPLAAGAGIWALLRGRSEKKEHHHRDRARSRSRSFISSRGPEVLPSRRGSESYVTEKDSEPPRRSGGGFTRVIGSAAAAMGVSKLVSGFMGRRSERRDEEYSAVSTETPRRHRSGRGDATTLSEFSSDYTEYPRRPEETQTSLLPPSANAPGRGDPRRPITPQPMHSRGRELEESEYSSYVSPSRRPQDDRRGTGVAKGILGGLGMGWFAKKLADRRARREEDRLREEEDMRSGLSGSRFTGDGYPSPTRRDSRRLGPVRRATGHPGAGVAPSEMTSITESSIDTRPMETSYAHGAASTTHPDTVPAVLSVPGPGARARSRSRSQVRSEHVSMPPMPPDTHSVVHTEAESFMSPSDGRPQRRDSSRRRRAGERAAAVAAARASEVAANERDRYGSPSSQPVSVRVKMHDDRDRNVTLRRLTETEARAVRGPASRRDSESSLSERDSPSYGRRYRRDSSQRRAERSAERRLHEDQLAPLSPPNPAFAKGGRRPKDSAYYSGPGPGPGQAGPSRPVQPSQQTMSSLGSESHGTWSAMSPSPSGPGKVGGGDAGAAEDRRRRRRLERRGAGSARPSESDMFD